MKESLHGLLRGGLAGQERTLNAVLFCVGGTATEGGSDRSDSCL